MSQNPPFVPEEDSRHGLDRLEALVARLRATDGCPWDRQQTLPDLRAYLLEEAHELADAIDRLDPNDLREELGDLLFQTAFIGRLAREQELFTLEEAIAGIERKMIERHPHVFGDEPLEDSAAVEAAWERRKLGTRSGESESRSALDGVPPTLPALLHSYRVGQKAAALGFDWSEPRQVLDKIREEIAEVEDELEREANPESGESRSELEEEIGDLLLAVANLSRHLRIDPEAALAAANRKFSDRFRAMESRARAEGIDPSGLDAAAWEALWDGVKRTEPR